MFLQNHLIKVLRVAVLQSLCIREFSDCNTVTELTDHAQTAVLERLNDLGLVGILPDGDCNVEATSSVNGTSETIACGYSVNGGAGITLTKLSLDQSRSALFEQKEFSRRAKRQMVVAARGKW